MTDDSEVKRNRFEVGATNIILDDEKISGREERDFDDGLCLNKDN